MKWLQEGDRNIKFFHLVASTGRRGNLIDNLSFQGEVFDKPEYVKAMIAEHFESHLNSSQVIKLVD